MYDEEDGIQQLFEQLDDALPRIARRAAIEPSGIEVIAVDDGSRDRTARLLAAAVASRPWLRIATHETNRGLGAALWTGFDLARADVIAAVDSDCTYPIAEVGELLGLLTPEIGIVTASPYHPKGGVEGVTGRRLLLSKGASALYSLILSRRLHTWTAMFRVYRRSAIVLVPRAATGFLAVTQMLVFPVLSGVPVREHPTVLRTRLHGASKMKVTRTIGQHLRFMGWLVARRLGLVRT